MTSCGGSGILYFSFVIHTYKRNGSMASLLTTALVLVLPAVELLLFRLWLRYGLELRLGLPGFVDYDLVLPCVISFFFFSWLLQKERRAVPTLQVANLLTNLVFVMAFAFVSAFFGALDIALGRAGVVLLWTSLLGGMVLTAFSVWVPFSYLVSHPRRWLLVPGVASASSMVLIKHLYPKTWPYFSSVAAPAICSTIQAFEPMTQCRWQSSSHFRIAHPYLQVQFGPPCSGMESLLVFLVGFAVFLAMDTSRLKALRSLYFFLGGILLALGMNIARVAGIFLLSLWGNKILGPVNYGTDFLVTFFHLHLGWVFYGLVWGAFFYLAHRMVPAMMFEATVRREPSADFLANGGAETWTFRKYSVTMD